MINVDWATLKSFLQQRNVSVQCVNINNSYYLWAFDGPMCVTTQISLVNPTPDGSDQQDFETNYQASSNQSPRASVVQQLGTDSFSIYAQGILFTAIAGQQTIWYYQIPLTLYARGGTLCSFSGASGDWISVDIVDKDNVTGQGGTPDNPTVLDDYIPKWYVMPGQNIIEDISISSPIPPGLYFRITYHSTGNTDTIVGCNLLTYVKV